MIYIILASLVLLTYLLKIWFGKQKRRIPDGLKEVPSVSGLPIIGILHKIEPPLCQYLRKLVPQYGPLFRIKMGMRDVFILNDFDVMKKCLKDQGDNFSGRWKAKVIQIQNHDSGILMKDGDVWAEQRSFVLKVLRDAGIGKNKAAEIVEGECILLLEELEKTYGKCTDFSHLIPIYTANIISKFIMNKRFSRDDPKIQYIEQVINETAKSKDTVQLIHMMFPALDKSEWITKFILFISSRMKKSNTIHKYFEDEIKEHESRLDLNSDGEDLIDKFLIKRNRMFESSGSVGNYINWQLIRVTFELFIAGYETTSTTLNWSFMFMSRYPEIQAKVHDEIIDQIGKERLPAMNDRKTLNYTQAVMDEILRLSTVAPLGLFHRNLTDASVNGFFIPKDSMIFPNLFACHVDPNIWEKPMEFYPEHFLSVNEHGELKYNPREELIPFGIGKRQCLGESLARMEYFIFFTGILQKFRVSLAKPLSDEEYKSALHGNDGFIRFSTVKDFVFTSGH